MYLDNPLELDWEEVETLDVLSVHDKECRIIARHVEDTVCYDLEAVGLYSCGKLVEVKDVDVVWAGEVGEI